MVGLCYLSCRLQVPWCLENPALSYAWVTPNMVGLARKPSVSCHLCEYCRFGTPWRKSTKFMCYLIDLSPLERYRCTGPCCVVTGKKHLQLSGRREDGQFRTKVAEAYPRGLCRVIANAFVNEQARATARQFQFSINRSG